VPDALIRPLAVVSACVAALVAVTVVHALLTTLGRRLPVVADLTRRAHRPALLLVLILTLDLSLREAGWSGHWLPIVTHLLDIVAIGAAAWLVAALLLVVEDAALLRYRLDVQDNREARTVHTQVQLLRRVTVAAVVMLSLIGALFTFREARLLGTSLLASAGVVAAVIGFAAQSLFGNVLAGLQITFGGALRLDDVVVIDREWGRIEDIRLTYVVVHIWDDRRLVLPTSYFTTTPFQNWTRTGSSLLGTVEFEVDWSVPVEAMRDELRRVLTDNSGMWDGRVSVLQVTDAVHGLVRLRALVSAPDAGTLWDLRCLVRERLVGWLRDRYPHALPRLRAEVGEPARPVPDGHHQDQRPTEAPDGDAQVFGGDPASRQRGAEFTGPDAG
jgi:hypothetical protein